LTVIYLDFGNTRQTRYSDLDLSFTALAVRTDAYKYSITFNEHVTNVHA